jgi:putative endonuclease
MNENYTYILRCADGTYYWTNNLDRRLKAHNEGKGAKYTRSRRPVALVYYEAFSTKEEAMRREYEIKQLPRKKKEELIFKQQTDTSSCNGRDFRP